MRAHPLSLLGLCLVLVLLGIAAAQQAEQPWFRNATSQYSPIAVGPPAPGGGGISVPARGAAVEAERRGAAVVRAGGVPRGPAGVPGSGEDGAVKRSVGPVGVVRNPGAGCRHESAPTPARAADGKARWLVPDRVERAHVCA